MVRLNTNRLVELRDHYRDTLLHNVLPFWQRHIRDDEFGGYLHHVDADGSVVSTDKAFWIVCRTVWMFSRCFNDIQRKDEWLDFARHGYEFIMKHGFDTDGRMFYSVTRDGQPLRKRRYLFTECFGVMALSEYGKATGNEKIIEESRNLYDRIIRLHGNPDASMPPKFFPARRLKSLAMPMILIGISQELRRNGDSEMYIEVIDRFIEEVLNEFLHHEKRALFENVGPNGELHLNIPEGRLINPGHSLEAAWFIMEEARHRNNRRLINDVQPIIDYSMELGWDEEFGGIFYFVDVEGKPPEQYEHDMKLWWVHTEALYAHLLAYRLTGIQKYWEWFEKLNTYCFDHFPDKDNGEWFGYLHRDGTLASTVKGSKWKGPFHLPRMLLKGWILLEEIIEDFNNNKTVIQTV